MIPVRVIDVYHPGDVDQKRPEVFERLERIADELYQNGAVKHDGR